MRSFLSLLKSPAYSEFSMVPRTRSIPAAAHPLPGRAQNPMRIIKRINNGDSSTRQTCRPVTRILTATQGHVPPEVSGALVAQVLAVKTDLVVALSHRGHVFGHDTIVGQEWWNHVDEVGPRGVMSR